MIFDAPIALAFSALVAFAVTLTVIRLLASIAWRLGLTDTSSGHKRHDGEVPTIGGISSFVGFVAGLAVIGQEFDTLLPFMTACGLLLIVGIADDRHMLPAWVRLAAQIVAALIMTLWADIRVESLGNLTGNGPILLGDWAVPFTVFGVVGVINAVNMIDGIDGLAGTIVLSVLTTLVILSALQGADGMTASMAVLAFSIASFLLFNHPHVGGPKRTRIFLGDAGTLFLGLVVAWCLVDLSQSPTQVIRPVSALWLLLIPLYDTIALMLRRIANRRSPFSPDREHLHHALMAIGISAPSALQIMSAMQILIITLVITTERLPIAEWGLFLIFVVLSLMYLIALSVFWHSRTTHRGPVRRKGRTPKQARTTPARSL